MCVEQHNRIKFFLMLLGIAMKAASPISHQQTNLGQLY